MFCKLSEVSQLTVERKTLHKNGFGSNGGKCGVPCVMGVEKGG